MTAPSDTVIVPVPQLPTCRRFTSPPSSMRVPLATSVPLPMPPSARLIPSAFRNEPASAEKLPTAPAPTDTTLPVKSYDATALLMGKKLTGKVPAAPL